MAIDDFLREVEADETEDRIEQQEYAAPIEYARTRGIAPQKVYNSLRNGKLGWYDCLCGRKVIKIEEADTLYDFKKEVEDDVSGELEESEVFDV